MKSLLSRIKKHLKRERSSETSTLIFTEAIDWKEPAPTALWALQTAYPDISPLHSNSMAQLAAMYSNVPIDEGEQALGQELSHYGYALYSVQTGNDESVYLLLQHPEYTSENDDIAPETHLYELIYQDNVCIDEPSPAYKVDAHLLLQPSKTWGQKAKRIRVPKLNVRMPADSLAVWNLQEEASSRERFSWINAEYGFIEQEQGEYNDYGGYNTHEDKMRQKYFRVHLQLWDEVENGIAHMLTEMAAHQTQRQRIDWSKVPDHHPLQANRHTLSEQLSKVSLHPTSLLSSYHSHAFRYSKMYFAVGITDQELGEQLVTPAIYSEDVWWICHQDSQTPVITLPIPTLFPPPHVTIHSLTPEIALPDFPPKALPCDYWATCILEHPLGGYWVACSLQLDYYALNTCVCEEEEQTRIRTAFDDSRFGVLLYYDKEGVLQRLHPYQHTANCWGRVNIWTSTPPHNVQHSAKNNARMNIHLLRSVVDDRVEQTEYSQFGYLEGIETHVPRLRFVSTAQNNIHDTAPCHVMQVLGLPSTSCGYLLYGGWKYICGEGNNRYSINAVDIETGKTWERNLQGMQPKWDKCRYSHTITPKLLPNDWIILDIEGDNWGLTDCAWFWHMPSDRFYALPLGAVCDDRENASLNYVPSLGCLFAHSKSLDRADIVERLRPLPELLQSIESNPTLIRAVPPWKDVTLGLN